MSTPKTMTNAGSNLAEASTGEIGTAVDLNEKVTLWATDDSPFHEKGEKTEVHPSMVKQFLKRGFSEKEVEADDEDTKAKKETVKPPVSPVPPVKS